MNVLKLLFTNHLQMSYARLTLFKPEAFYLLFNFFFCIIFVTGQKCLIEWIQFRKNDTMKSKISYYTFS